ncbi:hypothetical protein ABL78_2079 [Leptomonas seymouri]|uniref:ATPase AAA-type core domain-containing protein n=1 Tax=Leptomonas seymouri TaxID=5684 RepID=A0A0N1PCX8_LEPSE|nr:hypothetical protein ABL78_2079 [Leptomonas seymouri]|eukprot:KPI88820.1 hypothetical protein ABL78_2079 [Leptomonas seymouri]
MVRRPAKSRQTSFTRSASSKASAASSKCSTARHASSSTSCRRKVHIEVIHDDAESIHSDDGSQSRSMSGGSVDFVEGKDNEGNSSKLTSSASPQTTASVVVDVKLLEPAEASAQHSRPSETQLASRMEPQHSESVTCVSDSGDEEETQRCMAFQISSSKTCAACVSTGDEDSDEDSDDVNSSWAQRQPPIASLLGSTAQHKRLDANSPSSPAAAPILGVSRLTDYFTYGVQAAMAHYADHFCEEETGGEEGREIRRSSQAGRAAARYRNNFLTDQSRCSHAAEAKLSNASSKVSSAATYDSDAEEGQFLEPQCTSLYRAPPCFTASESIAADSWSGATPQAPAATAATTTASSTDRHTLKLPASQAFPSRDAHWKSGNAQACFREALRRAYACGDAVRNWKRDEVNQQRAQLIRVLMKLKGDSDRVASQKAAAHDLIDREQQRGPAARGRSPAACQDWMQQQQRAAGNTGPPSTLSGSAEYAQAIGELPSTTSSSTLKGALHLSRASTARAKQATQHSQQCDAPDVLCAVDNDGEDEGSVALATSSARQTETPVAEAAIEATAPPDPPSRHRLQVMDPSQLYKLRCASSVLVDTLLKHHREAQLKQRAAQHVEDHTVNVRRLYELPVLTEDIVRYAVLLLCLKRTHKQPISAVADAASTIGSGSEHGTAQCPAGDAIPQPTPHSMTSPTTNAMSSAAAPSLFTNANDSADIALPYGEDGALLYMKYPAPLLRTTSFAVETVRLLKWLRTWKNSGSATAGNPTSPPPVSTPSSGVSQRKRVKTEAPTESHRRGAAVKAVEWADQPAPPLSVGSPSASNMEARPEQPSPVEGSGKQHQPASEAQQEKRSVFLGFFGAAAIPPCGTTKSQSAVVSPAKTEGGGIKAGAQTPISSAASPRSIAQQGTGVKDEEEEHIVIAHPVRRAPASSHAASSTVSSAAAPPQPLINPAVYAYQLYCHAWKHAVKTGITPLATAVQAFSGSRPCTPAGTSPLLADGSGVGRVMRKGDGEDNAGSAAGVGNAASRVCQTLPFYKEMHAEAQRTALGSATRGAYYEDAYGNRLRSARLAQKERARQEQLAAQQRRWAKKRGYFHRDDAEEGVAGRSAAAMLEAMLAPTSESEDGQHAAQSSNKHRAKRRREHATGSEDASSPMCISNDDDDDGTAVVARPRSTKRKARGQPRSRSSSPDAVCSSSSSSSASSSDRPYAGSSRSGSDVGNAEEEDDAAAKDEITNIAVVSGPTGSGKTAAVYVAAQLLGFRVVEMNASVRRCSKTVEHLLAELTRSYRLSGLRSGPSGFNVEEELTKLKQQHAALMEKAKAEAEAAEREAEQKRREARKANGISAQAVVSFFSRSSTPKTPGKAAGTTARQQQPSTATNVDEVAENDTAALASPPSLSSATMLSPPRPPPLPSPSTNAASPVGVRTLLLFEDADILLGDESAKPFYAAIRDLAHRSKVPIAVTVSTDPSPSQRYDMSPGLCVATAGSDNVVKTPTTTALSTAPLRPTYWQLCEEAGVNTPMDSLEAAFNALHASPVGGDRASNAVMSDSGTGGSGGNGSGAGPDSAASLSSGNSPLRTLSGTASATPLFPPPSTTAAGGPTAATGSTSNGAGVSSLSPTGLSSSNNNSSCCASAASSVAARYTHVLLNASLVSNFFGTQTPFTVVDALPSSALYAQLLAVGAVELDLFHWRPSASQESLLSNDDAALVGSSTSAVFLSQLMARDSEQSSQISWTPSSSTWQQDMDRLASSLSLRDPELFFQLAELLCRTLFGVGGDGEEGGIASTSKAAAAVEGHLHNQKAAPPLEPTLPTAIGCTAATHTTTDIRYWLNQLQMLLLTLRSRQQSLPNHDPGALASTAEQDSPRCCELPLLEGNDGEADKECCTAEADTQRSNAGQPHCRTAERLLEGEFQQYTSFAASWWDSALGQYMAHLSHNELQSSRYEHWLLDDHVDYAADIVGEMNTQDHPTLHIHYTSSPNAKSSHVPQPAPARRGRPPSSAEADKSKASRTARTSTPLSSPSTKAASTASNNNNSSSSSGNSNDAAHLGGLNPAWKALFGGAKGGGVAAVPSSSASSYSVSSTATATASPSTLPGGQQTLFGLARGTSAAGAPLADSAYTAGALLDVPARYEWPPALHELRKQANTSISTFRLRPVELLLPYSTAQAYYNAAATSASSSALNRVPDVAEPSPYLLGHDTPLRFVNRQGGHEMIEEDGDYCEVGREMPASVHVTQEERFAVFRRWWRRTRKVGVLRDSIAGRSAAALEDMLGHACLMAPPSAATSGSR